MKPLKQSLADWCFYKKDLHTPGEFLRPHGRESFARAGRGDPNRGLQHNDRARRGFSLGEQHTHIVPAGTASGRSGTTPGLSMPPARRPMVTALRATATPKTGCPPSVRSAIEVPL